MMDTPSQHNLYGDLLVFTTGDHGADIASQHRDDLDRACLAYAETLGGTNRQLHALDIGGASGAQSKRLAALGFDVWLIDLTDQHAGIDEENRRLGRTAINFIQSDVRHVFAQPWLGPRLDIVYAQRMLNYLTYGDAKTLLSAVVAACAPGARFFVSTAGLETEFGQGYPDRDKPIEDRFSSMAQDIAQKHGMRAPQCLYTEKEFATLLEACHLMVEKTWCSPFGDPKAVARLDCK